MEKDKSQNISGSSLPPSGRNSFGSRGEPSGSTTLPPMGPETSRFGGHEIPSGSNSSHFSHDISRMPDNPSKNLGHRRAHSEILTLPDDISFNSDLGVVGGPDETEEDMFSMFLDMDKLNSSSATSDSEFHAQTSEAATPQSEDLNHSSVERSRVRHQHSQSMDGSSTIQQEMLTSAADAKKSMAAAKLAELALVDPKRAKRIWANRQSAARSKERKMRYIGELERKLQTLQTEATSLSAQLTLMQRDTNGLTVENGELKLRLQTMEQQVHLQDALNEALKEEIQHLKVLTGQNPFGSTQKQQFYSNSQQAMLTAHQFQQLQIQQHKQFRQFQQENP